MEIVPRIFKHEEIYYFPIIILFQFPVIYSIKLTSIHFIILFI